MGICPPVLSTKCTQALDSTLLAIEPGNSMDGKKAHGIGVQLGELSLVADYQLAYLKVK